MRRTNKETVKAHIDLLMNQLAGESSEAHKSILNSLQYAKRAVDDYNPQKKKK